MKVFLGWSGDRSYKTAQAFHDWLPKVIQAIDPFISSGIPKGKRWGDALAEELEETKVGILCLTRDNLNSNWILFEAGALSKTKDAHVCTFLLDIRPTDIKEPLASFQHTAFEKEDIKKLLETINNAVKESNERALSESSLNELFETFWPQLETMCNSIEKIKATESAPARKDRDLLEEILSIARELKEPIEAIRADYEERDRVRDLKERIENKRLRDLKEIMEIDLKERMEKERVRREHGPKIPKKKDK